MTIEQAIQKAIKEGGYKMQWDKGLESAYPFRALLDEKFWQALGKAMGWSIGEEYNGINYESSHSGEWKRKWHQFIDHLAEGKTIESYFENL